MFRRALWAVAGIDREALENCPATDVLWATHLGFSLILSFTVVFGISLHAISYIVEDLSIRFLVAAVIALTIFMFDRALYQSDWFSQGFLRRAYTDDASGANTEGKRVLWRFFRIAIRLSISFALAWMIALFLELAIFSDTITDKIKRSHTIANQHVFQKIDRYEAALDLEIAQRRQNLTAVEATYREKLLEPVAAPTRPLAVINSYERQFEAIDKEERELREAIRELNATITSYSEEMNAEQRGQKLKPSNSGRAGMGARYEFARQQRDLFLDLRSQRETELALLAARRDELRVRQQHATAETSSRVTDERASTERTRWDIQSQLEIARHELRGLENARDTKLDAFRRQTLSSEEFKKLKNDPLARMTAYQELKSDPIDGSTIIFFSWMTKLLIIFLEIVPVVAKIFFSPPSVYAARLQANVSCERARIQQELIYWENQQQLLAERLRQTAQASSVPLVGDTNATLEPVAENQSQTFRDR